MSRDGVEQSRPRNPHERTRQEQTSPMHYVRQSLYTTSQFRKAYEKTYAGRDRRKPHQHHRAGRIQTELLSATEIRRGLPGFGPARERRRQETVGVQDLSEEVRAAGQLRETHEAALRAGGGQVGDDGVHGQRVREAAVSAQFEILRRQR